MSGMPFLDPLKAAKPERPARLRFWAADPHQYGPGKVHLVSDEDAGRTLCGQFLAACPGQAREVGPATCRLCLNVEPRRAAREAAEAAWQAQVAEAQRQRQEEDRAWWARYTAYLQSPEWGRKSAAVIRRDHGICQACGRAPATQAHHLTYKHLFAEPLFELVAICRPCHERLTALDRSARSFL